MRESNLSLALYSTRIDARALSATITLPAGGEAALELFDLAGRRMVHRAIAGGVVGEQRISMTLPRSVASGVYWLVLRHGMERATARVAVLR